MKCDREPMTSALIPDDFRPSHDLVARPATAKAGLGECLRRVDTQALTDANNMLFKILATLER